MDSLDYLVDHLNLSNNKSFYNLSFIDTKMEDLYFNNKQDSEIKKLKFCCLIVLLGTAMNLFITILYNPKLIFILPRVFIPFIDLGFMLIQVCYIVPKRKNWLNTTKFLRFLVIYCISFYLFISLSSQTSSVNQTKIVFYLMIYYIFYDLFMIYFLDFNLIMMTFILLGNIVLIFEVNQNLKITEVNIYILIPVIILYFFTSIIFKKNLDTLLRDSFFETYKSNFLKGYIHKLIDDINFQFVSLKNQEIIYSNKFFKLKFGNEIGLLNDNQVTEFHLENFTYLNDLNSNQDKNLLEKINELETNNENLFESLGQFQYKTVKGDLNYFDIFSRKNTYDTQLIIDLIMYDLTKIKVMEKHAVENKYKQKILAKIAHEFKSPLITISSLIKSNDEKDYNTDINIAFKHISNLTNYTLYLISDMIQYVSHKIDKGQFSLELVDIKRIIYYIYDILETLIYCNEHKMNHIVPHLDFDPPVGPINVLSNENTLKQILLNIVSHTIKFTDQGKISIKAHKNQASKSFSIIISDTGREIKNKNPSNLIKEDFEVDLDENLNDDVGSNEIGIELTKSLCDKLNHEFKIKSRKNGGSRYEIIIPFDINKKSTNNLIQPEINIFENTSESESSTIIKDYEFRKNNFMKNSRLTRFVDENEFFIYNFEFSIEVDNSFDFSFIIVDDLQYVRKNTLNLFNQILDEMNLHNYKIFQVSDGIELLDLLRKDQSNNYKIRAIFVDEDMEYMKGSESIKIIRNLGLANKFKTYKIYSITAFEDEFTKNEINKSKPDGILIKPASKSTIKKIFTDLLNEKYESRRNSKYN